MSEMERLHMKILRKMQEHGDVSPWGFWHVLDSDHDLVVKYLKNCGLDIKDAVMDRIGDEDCVLELTMQNGQKMESTVRFVRQEAKA